jgi:hypothetical protein
MINPRKDLVVKKKYEFKKRSIPSQMHAVDACQMCAFTSVIMP